MPLIAWMLLAAATSVELVDQTFLIPANDWRFVDLGLKRRAALVQAEFHVEKGPPVQLTLMEHADLELLNRGEMHAMVAATPPGERGRLVVRTRKFGDYVVVIENRSGRPETAQVRLRVTVDFAEATQISPERQLAVIAISLAVFFGIVAYSARQLWKSVHR